jgi:hypothetical protein
MVGDANYDPDIDMTGDGTIGSVEFAELSEAFGNVYGDDATMPCKE